jgi:hypothetical protein
MGTLSMLEKSLLIPAFAIKVSRRLMPCFSSSETAFAGADGSEESRPTMISLLFSPTGRDERDEAVAGLRTAAITVVFGRER